MTRKALLAPILIASAAALAVSSLGAWLTVLGPWYRALVRPPWQPPDAWFGIAWTTIFALAAAAGVMAWRAAPDSASRRAVIVLFAINGALNTLWSVLFFRLQRPDWALMEIGFLWLSIAVLMWRFKDWSKAAALLLLPYLLWVSFASLLNLSTVRLNGPF
ncbi:TspO/MBR family protein [Polaromonas sp. YR568]|uniref:TspO/MBR family protein n=1 Tax=Polaromonas sp. YR568 TaxID=1855301 RepID=UPI003138130E